MMYLTKDYVGIFKVLRITELDNIFESFTDIGNPFHDSWSFYFYHCIITERRITCINIDLVLTLILTFIESVFENINEVVCLFLKYNEGNTDIFDNKEKYEI